MINLEKEIREQPQAIKEALKKVDEAQAAQMGSLTGGMGGLGGFGL